MRCGSPRRHAAHRDSDLPPLRGLSGRARGMPGGARRTSASTRPPTTASTRSADAARVRGSTRYSPARIPRPGRLGARADAQPCRPDHRRPVDRLPRRGPLPDRRLRVRGGVSPALVRRLATRRQMCTCARPPRRLQASRSPARARANCCSRWCAWTCPRRRSSCSASPQTAVGFAPVILTRAGFTGELGYELWTTPDYFATLYEELWEAGRALGLVHFGGRALSSLRLEKAYGSFNKDFRPDYTPGETGLDRFIDFDKAGFTGREAALAERTSGAEAPFRRPGSRGGGRRGRRLRVDHEGRRRRRLRHLRGLRALHRQESRRRLRARPRSRARASASSSTSSATSAPPPYVWRPSTIRLVCDCAARSPRRRAASQDCFSNAVTAANDRAIS